MEVGLAPKGVRGDLGELARKGEADPASMPPHPGLGCCNPGPGLDPICTLDTICIAHP